MSKRNKKYRVTNENFKAELGSTIQRIWRIMHGRKISVGEADYLMDQMNRLKENFRVASMEDSMNRNNA